MLSNIELEHISWVVNKWLEQRDIILERSGIITCSEFSNEKELHKWCVSNILWLSLHNEKIVEIIAWDKYILLEIWNWKYYLYDKVSKIIDNNLEILTNFSFTNIVFKNYSWDVLVLIKTSSWEWIFSLNKWEIKINFSNLFRIEDYKWTLIAWIKPNEEDLMHQPYCLESWKFLDINSLIEDEEDFPILDDKVILDLPIKPIPLIIPTAWWFSNPDLTDLEYKTKWALKGKPDWVEHIVTQINLVDWVILTERERRILDGVCNWK